MAREFLRASTQYMSVADPAVIAISTGDFTIAGWVWLYNGGGCSISRGDASPSRLISVEWLNSAQMRFELYDGTHNPFVDGPTFSGGAWEHFAVVRDAGTLRTYRNGVAGATGTDTTGDLSNSGLTWYQGFRTDNAVGGSKYQDGKQAEVSIFLSALSATHIANLAGGTGANCEGTPVADWRMVTNTSPEPDSVNGNNMTLVNSPAFVSGNPTVTWCDSAGVTYPQLERFQPRGVCRGVFAGH